MSTRREFLYQVGTGALGLMGLKLFSGCEHISVDSKIDGGLVDFITPADHPTWYWQSGEGGVEATDPPTISRSDWSLAIHDKRDNQVGDIGFDALTQLENDGEAITYIKTMRCVFGSQVGALSDSLVSTGIFKGIPLHHVVESNGIGDAKKLRTFGVDGFKSNLSMDRVLTKGTDPLPVILAYELNGEPLTPVRGGPVRVIIPEMWGYKNMKWLTKIRASDEVKEDLDPSDDDEEYFGDYEHEKFDRESIDDPADISLNSAFTRPAAIRQEFDGSTITVAGVSFAGARAIESVELSLDDGPFETVDLMSRERARQTIEPDFVEAFDAAEMPGDHWPPANVWALWTKTYEGLSTGDHAITVRATDTTGDTQPTSSDDRLTIASQKRLPFTLV